MKILFNNFYSKKLITEEEWYSERIAGTNLKLFNDNGESYKKYLLEYKSRLRDQKINDILNG